MKKTAEQIKGQFHKLAEEAKQRYGSYFTERNLTIYEAYCKVMNQLAREQVKS